MCLTIQSATEEPVVPARSNEFQKLVLMVKRHVSTGAEVRESAALKDLVTGADREVDVVIETVVGGHRVIVSLECRDRSRPADVGWIEQMRAKHDRLPTNALVLVSRNGFTKQAAQVAESYGIEILNLEETTESDVDRLFGETNTLWGKTFSLTPTKVVVCVPTDAELPAERVVTFQDTLMHAEDGSVVGTIRELVERILHTRPLIEDLGRDATDEHKGFSVEWTFSAHTSVERLYLQKLEPKRLRRIEAIIITGSCEFKVSRFDLHRGRIGQVEVAWGRGRLMELDALLVASKDAVGQSKLSLNFSGPGGPKAKP
jgi:hypothetical protein